MLSMIHVIHMNDLRDIRDEKATSAQLQSFSASIFRYIPPAFYPLTNSNSSFSHVTTHPNFPKIIAMFRIP